MHISSVAWLYNYLYIGCIYRIYRGHHVDAAAWNSTSRHDSQCEGYSGPLGLSNVVSKQTRELTCTTNPVIGQGNERSTVMNR
jgi:hypothetical protein